MNGESVGREGHENENVCGTRGNCLGFTGESRSERVNDDAPAAARRTGHGWYPGLHMGRCSQVLGKCNADGDPSCDMRVSPSAEGRSGGRTQTATTGSRAWKVT